MTDWLTAIKALADQATPAMLVTVAHVEGSAPREAGAKMLVTRVAQFDTIGGGHLEMQACNIAREMLTTSAERRISRFALGPSLGQCCGGVVHLCFERIAQDAYAYYDCLSQRWHERKDSWRLVSLDTALPPVLLDHAGHWLAGAKQAPRVHVDRERPCHVMKDENAHHWLIDPCLAYRPHLALFGAGHVGAAIVRTLAPLPCHVTWVDERDDIFPPDVPANVTVEVTDTPETIVDVVAVGTSYLVMTHSHALDLRLSEAILNRADAGWFGLVGSTTKRRQFEHRLRERGLPAERLTHMVCPIGLPGITGKAPAVIAASVCAQLLLVWEHQSPTIPALHHHVLT